MNIGEIRNVNGRFLGHIATRTIDLPRIGLRPVESENPRAPKYEVVALNVARRWVQVGAVWEAEAKKSGEVFLAGNIDDPSLPDPLPVALFRNEDGNGYAIAWRRDTLRTEFGGTGFGASNYDRGERGDEPRGDRSAMRGGGRNFGGFGESTVGEDGAMTRAMEPLDDDIGF